MTGNEGQWEDNGLYVRALVLESGSTRVCMVSTDSVGAEGLMNRLAYGYAAEMGFTVPFNNTQYQASHSHSGPGAIGSDFLWSRRKRTWPVRRLTSASPTCTTSRTTAVP